MRYAEHSRLLGPITAQVDRATRRRQERGEPGAAAAVTLARDDGWAVDDVVCSAGPDDRPFEERHDAVSIAIVLAGTFQYRVGNSSSMMTPGSVLLGNAGECFECGHAHTAGDRCVSFHFSPELYDRIAFDAAGPAVTRPFPVGRLPALPELSRVSALAAVGVIDGAGIAWDELAIEVAGTVARLATGAPARATSVPRGAEAKVSRAVRMIARDPSATLTIHQLAAGASLSPFHFLRTFKRVTGVTPHQFIMRMRLREAAARLATRRSKVIEVSLDAGFNDLSTFNAGFRAEFGMSPSAFSRRVRP